MLFDENYFPVFSITLRIRFFFLCALYFTSFPNSIVWCGFYGNSPLKLAYLYIFLCSCIRYVPPTNNTFLNFIFSWNNLTYSWWLLSMQIVLIFYLVVDWKRALPKIKTEITKPNMYITDTKSKTEPKDCMKHMKKHCILNVDIVRSLISCNGQWWS